MNKHFSILISLILLSFLAQSQNDHWTYKIIGNNYISKTIDNGNLRLDTVRLYTPIRNIDGNELDTLLVVEYSKALFDLGEPMIFNSSFKGQNDVIRLSWFKDTIPVIYRIEKQAEDIRLTKKESYGSYFSKLTDSVETSSYNLSNKQYKLIVKKLIDNSYWSLELDAIMIPRDIIIETKINGDYHFINTDNIALQKNRKLFSIFTYLDKLSKEE